jgi:PrtD family type I secretion system ABC transporter
MNSVVKQQTSTLLRFLTSFRGAFAGVGFLSGVINILALTSSIFMMQVYDRVIPSRSMPTLVGLLLFAAMLYCFHAALEIIRSRLLWRVSLAFDRDIGGRLHRVLLSPENGSTDEALQNLRDLDQCRNFMAGGGAVALFELPWLPLYIGLCFLLHPMIGFITLIGGGLLVGLTLLTELFTRRPLAVAGVLAVSRMAMIASTHRNREAVRAMGFGARLAIRWSELNGAYLDASTHAADAANVIGVTSKMTRIALQSALLAAGAYLVTQQKTTGGVMIASSIIMGRTLAPIETAIAQWKNFVTARDGWKRLRQRLSSLSSEARGIAPPKPVAEFAAESLSVVAPGSDRLLIQDVSFRIAAGAGVGIIGSSGSGKSTLARALVGCENLLRGCVRLDGSALEQWPQDDLGRHIGYLPQGVDLLAGTIAENIARFDPAAKAEDIHAAAKAAGVHDLIVRLPNGFETLIGENGAGLSAGQRQRIGLARALFGEPFLVVLDEPNANLDAEGESAVVAATLGVRARGGVVVVIAHRPSALAGVDHVLVMNGGTAQAFGPKEEVLNRALHRRPTAQSVTPLRAVAK